MDCKVFTENLQNYILDDVSVDLKNAMKEHMMSCRQCRELYNEEIFIEQSIEEVLNTDDVVFESQKDKIIQKIDTKKYKKNTPITKKKHFAGYLKIGAPIAAAIAFIMIINPVIRNKSENLITMKSQDKAIKEKKMEDIKNQSRNIQIQMRNAEENQIQNSIPKSELKKSPIPKVACKEQIANNITDTPKKIDNPEQQEVSNPKQQEIHRENTISSGNGDADNRDNYEKSNNNDAKPPMLAACQSVDVEVQFNKRLLDEKADSRSMVYSDQTSYLDNEKNSPNKKLSAYIIKQDINKNVEDKFNQVYVKNLEDSSKWVLELKTDNKKFIPKYIKWNDDEKLFVIVNQYEDKESGEELYILNANTGKAEKLYKLENDKSRIIELNNINKNDLEIKIEIHDDNSNETTIENDIIYNINDDVSEK
ncbi:DUF4652 domain-containing protein [Clostridium aestuarii]|uniref:DUF4652 domain-containing protein n=1 Tax=Clostridium aestuarii TaxID=338193 RepID=A0ABT4CWS7_9CLOT|nr:DUF4652 domain-containing protein [Clostridium aestuarii]MCY6483452.1 DUF4652 domain-containing protein [Clostridium aestuarii]